MNSVKTSCMLIIFLFLQISSSLCQTKQKNLPQYFSTLSENQDFNGNVLVAEDGKVIYEDSFGYADFSNKDLNSINILFPIASISKTFTATAILQLHEKGKLNVNESVTKYIPEFPYPEIKIRNLLSHTSGLPPYNAFFDSIKSIHPDTVFTNNVFINELHKNPLPLLYKPGEKGNYDNTNYIVLALLIEKVSGINEYSIYIKKNILDPAGMDSTTFSSLSGYKGYKQFAYPHLYLHMWNNFPVNSNTINYIYEYWHAYQFSGFGDYISTIHDLLKYDEALYNGVILNRKTLEMAYKTVLLNDGTVNPNYFGLGWDIEKDSSMGKVVYHSGAVTGLSCILLRNITKHQTVILFDNSHYNAYEKAINALKILNGRKVEYPPKSIAKIFGRVLINQGIITAKDTLYELMKDTINYELSESELNALGYDFMNKNNPYHLIEDPKYNEALETFKFNMELFPSSWNVYDSYGEALLKTDQKDKAIKMYKKSIELNPNNENGKKILEELLKDENN